MLENNYNWGLPFDVKPDFFISLNVLSQLSIFITDFLKKNGFNDEQKIQKIQAQIQQHHINMLPKNKSCLIVDYFESEYDISDKLINKTKRINIKLPAGNTNKEWKWFFDTKGNYKRNRKYIFKVKGINL